MIVSDRVTLRPGVDLPLDVVSVGPLFARAIRALHAREPLGDQLASR